MNKLRQFAQILLPLAAVAAVIAALMWPEAEKKPITPEELAPAPPVSRPEAVALAEPASPSQQAVGPRPASSFPDGAPWQFGALRGTQWQPLRPQTAWLVVAPAAGEQAQDAVALVRNLWTARDIGAILLAAPPTPAVADAVAERLAADQTWAEVVQGVTAQQPGAMVVLLGAGSAGEAALRWAADPRVLAVAALDVGADLPWLADQGWRAAAAKKHLWMGGPVERADAVDRLSRGLPHARHAASGSGRGLKWLAVADQRAALSGWLGSALGR